MDPMNESLLNPIADANVIGKKAEQQEFFIGKDDKVYIGRDVKNVKSDKLTDLSQKLNAILRNERTFKKLGLDDMENLLKNVKILNKKIDKSNSSVWNKILNFFATGHWGIATIDTVALSSKIHERTTNAETTKIQAAAEAERKKTQDQERDYATMGTLLEPALEKLEATKKDLHLAKELRSDVVDYLNSIPDDYHPLKNIDSLVKEFYGLGQQYTLLNRLPKAAKKARDCFEVVLQFGKDVGLLENALKEFNKANAIVQENRDSLWDNYGPTLSEDTQKMIADNFSHELKSLFAKRPENWQEYGTTMNRLYEISSFLARAGDEGIADHIESYAQNVSRELTHSVGPRYGNRGY